jgi:hypothetical protein
MFQAGKAYSNLDLNNIKYSNNNNQQYKSNPSHRCLHFEAVGGLEWSNDPESYTGSSVATGRFSLAGQVEGDDPD